MFHINMPKLCHERVDNDQDSYVKTDIATCLNVISGLNTEEGVQDDKVNPAIAPPLERKETIYDVHISHDLSEEEKKQLKDLLREYQDLPQVTNIIEHKGVTKTEEPIYKRPYPIPYALRDKVKTETDNMIKAGIIEPSHILIVHTQPRSFLLRRKIKAYVFV